MNKISGFTLIELAMVLFIITLILGGVLTPLSVRMEQEERKKTAEQLRDIKASLVGYTLVNSHLPCPDCPDGSVGNCSAMPSDDINDGIEDGNDDVGNPLVSRPYNSCATVEGNLPWATLGVVEFDAWDNHFTYRVTDEYADNDDGASGCSNPTAGVSFCVDSTGNIDVNDDGGNPIAQALPALIISYGKYDSKRGASETANQDPTSSTFVQKDYTTGEVADEFDDMLTWLTSSTLVYRMVQAERLP